MLFDNGNVSLVVKIKIQSKCISALDFQNMNLSEKSICQFEFQSQFLFYFFFFEKSHDNFKFIK